MVLRGHVDDVNSAVFSPDGKYVLTGSKDKEAWVWRADNSEPPYILGGHEGRIYDAVYSRADGRRRHRYRRVFLATSKFHSTAL